MCSSVCSPASPSSPAHEPARTTSPPARVGGWTKPPRGAVELDERAVASTGEHEKVAAGLAAIEANLGADAAKVAEELKQARAAHDRIQQELPTLRQVERRASNAEVEARVLAETAAGAVGAAENEAADADRLLDPYARPELALACDLDASQPWREALERSSRGRSPSDDSLKSARTAVLSAYEDLDRRLGGRHPAHLDFDDTDLAVVTIDDETGPAPIALFARRLAEQEAEQSAVLVRPRAHGVRGCAALGSRRPAAPADRIRPRPRARDERRAGAVPHVLRPDRLVVVDPGRRSRR